MLHRIIYASEAVGATGASTLSVAQILGESERNNRRDDITSCVMFHRGHILHVIEGARGDLDRLMNRLLADGRHSRLRILCDDLIARRGLSEPISLCADPAGLLTTLGLTCLSSVTAPEAEIMLGFRKAA